jgi:hypothetical protein
MLTLVIVIWAALLATLVGLIIGWRRERGALTLSYFLGVSLIHVPGALAFLGPVPIVAHWGLGDRYATELGFEMTVIGLAAFVVGAIIASVLERRRVTISGLMPQAQAHALTFQRVGQRAVIIGAIAFFVLLPWGSLLPSITALVSAIATLLILGLWLVVYGAVLDSNPRRLRLTLVLLPLLPLSTLITGGFLGYGIFWILSVVAFVFVIAPRRAWFFVTAPLVLYLGLSLFVTYMGQRVAIREAVWRQQAGIAERVDRISKIVTEFHFFDFHDANQVTALDDRLNLNAYTGRAMQRIASGWVDYAYGATMPISALIPRAIWPDKPAVGGGGTVVSDFTGIPFDRYTSVGTGQVFEFYVNFGLPGVVGGFLLFGFMLMWLDCGIMRALAVGDARGLLLRALPGLAMLQPGGNLVEILVAVAGAVFVGYLMMHATLFQLVRRARLRRRPA